MLENNTILTRLTLSRNNISDEGVQELANAIQNRNETLQTLSFTGNKFLTDSSVDSLINMFRYHQSLEKIWVNDCNLSETGQYRLKKRQVPSRTSECISDILLYFYFYTL